jgi:beta-lactamase regulating signal transducer with metallopeptidase domain
MNACFETAVRWVQRSAYPGAWMEVMLESIVLLAVAAALSLLCRRSAAATRHLIWFVALASLPLLLCFSLKPPSWERSLWSVTSHMDSGNQFSLALNLAPSWKAGDSIAPVSSEAERLNPKTPPAASAGPAFTARVGNSWLVALSLIYGTGAVLCLLSILAGRLGLQRLTRNARAFAGLDALLFEACQTLRLRRPPSLLVSPESLMPRTWGWLRPKVLLPGVAVHWPAEKCRLVLLHELAHVKRRDCLTQELARVVCAFFWMNPLVWLAARRMCIERERACDDLVLQSGCRSTDYASQLVDIARRFRHARFAAGIAMARPAHLQGRIAAIVDGSRNRRLRPAAAAGIIALMILLAGALGGTSGRAAPDPAEAAEPARQQLKQLRTFSLSKYKQSEALAAKAGETISPQFQKYFDAALAGDFETVTNRYEYYKRHNPQYVGGTNAVEILHTAYWQPVLELCLAYDHFANGEPKYTRIYVDEILKSIPPGSIYFGGTDPGRGLPTAFMKSSIEGDPFFCLTQNALADSSYVEYLRGMYGEKIYTPTSEDSQKCFQEYLADAQRRLQLNKLKPGEDVRVKDNRVSVSGQVAVMSINALLAKVIFDRNPGREFYIEESFPLEWMYPHLEPHGLILKINRRPEPRLSEEVLTQDREYWSKLVAAMLGDSFGGPSSVADLAAFVQRVHARRDTQGFQGDPLYLGNDYAKKIFSKLRSSIAGVYAWRLNPDTPAEYKPKDDTERDPLIRETDFAFRQAFALCPYSPEAVFRYVTFLARLKRFQDARLIAEASLAVDPKNAQVKDLLRNLDSMAGR